MKTGKVAKVLGVDQKTITNWTDHAQLRRFFSKEALGETGETQRDYLELDLIILNTIRTARAKNSDWDEIAQLLESGEYDSNLPPTALLVDTSAPIQQYGKMMTLMAERDNYKKQVEQLLIEGEQKDKTIAALQLEIQKLNREIGKWEGKFEMLQDEDNK